MYIISRYVSVGNGAHYFQLLCKLCSDWPGNFPSLADSNLVSPSSLIGRIGCVPASYWLAQMSGCFYFPKTFILVLKVA